MRVLLLCSDAYGGHGGIALFNRELAAALVARPDLDELVIVPRVVRGEVRGVPPKVTFLADAAKGPLAYMRALARVHREKFDLAICGHRNLLRVTPKPCVLIIHGIEAWRPSRISLRRVRAVVSVSALTRDRFVEWSHYDGPTFVLPNAVHLDDYGIRPKNPRLVERFRLEGKRVLLTVGRLDAAERSKGFDEVLEVMRKLPEDVVYLIAGGGNDFERLQKKAVDLSLTSRVIFTGLFDEGEKPDLYNLADVYVMPSRGEGFGFVFLEAMACGVPAIASKIDGGREALLGGELGLLVDPANPAEIRDAILYQLAHGKREIPAELAYFAFERFVERVSGIVDAMQTSPSPRRAGRGPG